MYFRRLQTQIDIVAKPEFSPFKKLDRVRKFITTSKPISKNVFGFYAGDDEKMIGYAGALSTFQNLRGFDGSDISTILFEEAIPKLSERSLPNEWFALMDAYETINRNREIDEGKPPVKLVLIGNSNNTAAPILVQAGLVSRIERMKQTGQQVFADPERSLLLIVLRDTKLGEEKADTAMYKFLGRDNAYTRASLDNSPPEEWGRMTASRPLREYKPVVAVGEICIYKHKSRAEWYVSGHVSGSPDRYGAGDQDLRRFRILYRMLWAAFIERRVWFENTVCEVLFVEYFNQ